jgi:hypothetical protein
VIVVLPAGPPEEEAFRLKTFATGLRAQGVTVVGVDSELTRDASWFRGVAAYVDFVVGRSDDASHPESVGGLAVWRRFRGPPTLDAILTSTMAGPRRVLVRVDEVAPELPLALARLRDLLPADLTPLADVAIACDGCTTRVFLHPRTLEAVGLVEAVEPVKQVVVSPSARRIELFALGDPSGPIALGPQRLSGTPAGTMVEMEERRGPLILRIAGWKRGDHDGFRSGVEVTAQAALSVEEIVSRHQARAARDKQDVKTLISSGSTILTFRVPGLTAPATVSAETVTYAAAGVTEVEERAIRLNGAPLGDTGVPRIPLIEPERVAAPPLSITLDEAYRYRLEGREEVEGHDCYVVRFEPQDAGRPLFRGRAFIDSCSFAAARIEGTQTGLRGPIVSSEQRDTFRPTSVGTREVWLLSRSDVRQVYEGAGRRTSIDRVTRIERHEPNAPDFAERLAAAQASPAVMLRDTPDGFRYLRREGSGAATRRVVAGKADKVWTATFGALFDPGVSGGLPFAGLGYLDFDFLGTGAQFSAFLAGAFVHLAATVPAVGGSRWQVHVTGLASLVEYNDRVFRQGVERYEENLRQRPARASLGVVRPLSPRSRLEASYEIAYTHLGGSTTTATDFVVPASPFEHGLRLGLEAQVAGWTTSAWWSPTWRRHWEKWGFAGNPELEAGSARFQRYGLAASRSLVLSSRTVVQIDMAWMAGRRLDRFSRYGFDQFENVLHGYGSATLRYDRGAVVRSALSWNAGRGLRLSGFVDGAHVRDPGYGLRARSYIGVGSALETSLPWRLRVVGEWGYGLQGRNREGEQGTHVFRLTGYRIF